MANDVKPKKIGYEKELKLKRDSLAQELAGMTPGTDEFTDTQQAIKNIDEILNAKSGARWKAVQVAGLILVSALGLGLAHKDDIGDTIPGKYVSKFVDTIFKRL